MPPTQQPVPRNISKLGHMPDHMAMVRLSALGDIVLTTGVLAYWREVFGLSFTVLTKAAFAPIFDHHPAVSRVVGLNPEDLRGKRQQTLFRSLAEDFAGESLIDLHGTLRTFRLGRVWKGPVYRYPKQAAPRRLFLLSRGKFYKGDLLQNNVPQRYAQALPLPQDKTPPSPSELRPRLFLSPEELAWADEALSPLLAPFSATNAGPEPLVALHPYATHAAKTWPPETWLRFAALLDARSIPYFWVGQSGRNTPGQDTASSFGTPGRSHGTFIDKTNLRQLAALLARADALVTGDSGPMHMATGVDTPVVALFGPTCREWGFFPSGERDVILQDPLPCRPCSLHGKGSCPQNLTCLAGLTPERALQALLPLFSH